MKHILTTFCLFLSVCAFGQKLYVGGSGGMSVSTSSSTLHGNNQPTVAWAAKAEFGLKLRTIEAGIQIIALSHVWKSKVIYTDINAQVVFKDNIRIYYSNPSFSTLAYVRKYSRTFGFGLTAGYTFAPASNIDPKFKTITLGGQPRQIATRIGTADSWSGFTVGPQILFRKSIAGRLSATADASALLTFASFNGFSTARNKFRIAAFPVIAGLHYDL